MSEIIFDQFTQTLKIDKHKNLTNNNNSDNDNKNNKNKKNNNVEHIGNDINVSKLNHLALKEKIKLCKEIAFELYSKYIDTGSVLEVNISSDMRSYYDELMQDHDAWISGKFADNLDSNNAIKNSYIYNNVEKGGMDFNNGIDYAKLFEPVILEMYSLLCFSLSRFKRKPEFEDMLKE